MKKFFHGMLFGLAVMASFCLGRRWPTGGQIGPDPGQVDTLYIRDTITVSKPIYEERTVLDTCYLPADTIRIHDTLFVALQKEQVRWADSLAVVYASGIMPHVDSVIHFTQNMVITKYVEKKVRTRWGLGVQAGIGADRNGLTPYVGAGVSYNILSW